MSEHTAPTKERILEAAGEIFGQRGFKDATIRAIAQAAEVNIAAINYHFRDKEGLYGAVLEEVFHIGFTRFPATLGLDTNIDPEQRLRAFIRAMFFRLLSREGWGGIAGRGRLIARELLAPSPAFEAVLDRYIKPHKDLLVTIIIEIMGVNPGPEKLMSCAISIIGQCIYYAMASPVIRKISTDNAPTEENLDRLAEFVWLFSLGGIAKIKDATLSPVKETV
ncbi:MAG: CerR family C-terminal domain-containing protein [Proteobacteria bacterium]|nr:CerR family C-terminal domain-containing protein [Pseudomonadota bacterium]